MNIMQTGEKVFDDQNINISSLKPDESRPPLVEMLFIIIF